MDKDLTEILKELGIPEESIEKVVHVRVSISDNVSPEEFPDIIIYIIMMLKTINRKMYDKIVEAILEDKDREGGLQ